MDAVAAMGEYDRYLIYGGAVSLALHVTLMLVVVAWRDHAVMQDKGAGLVLLHLLSGLVWFASSMVVDEHLPVGWLNYWRGEDWALCVFWAHWAQICMGWGTWFTCCLVRNYRLYKRCVKGEEPFHWVVHVTVYLLPWFLIVLVDQVLFTRRHGTDTSVFGKHFDHCMWTEVPWEVHSLYSYLMFSLFLFISVRGRRYGDRFNDYFAINTSVALALFVWLGIFGLIFMNEHFTEGARFFKSASILVLVTQFALCSNVSWAFNATTNSERYSEEFDEQFECVHRRRRRSSLRPRLTPDGCLLPPSLPLPLQSPCVHRRLPMDEIETLIERTEDELRPTPPRHGARRAAGGARVPPPRPPPGRKPRPPSQPRSSPSSSARGYVPSAGAPRRQLGGDL